MDPRAPGRAGDHHRGAAAGPPGGVGRRRGRRRPRRRDTGARADLGVEISIDLREMKADDNENSQVGFAEGPSSTRMVPRVFCSMSVLFAARPLPRTWWDTLLGIRNSPTIRPAISSSMHASESVIERPDAGQSERPRGEPPASMCRVGRVRGIGSAVFSWAKLDRAEKAPRCRIPHRPGDPRTRDVVLVPMGDDSTNVLQVLMFGRQRREVEPASDVRLMFHSTIVGASSSRKEVRCTTPSVSSGCGPHALTLNNRTMARHHATVPATEQSLRDGNDSLVRNGAGGTTAPAGPGHSRPGAGPTGGFHTPGGLSGADDGTRSRHPHLGNRMAIVSFVSTNLSSAPELRVLVTVVSSVSADRWSRLHFVGDFVGAIDE